MADVLVVAAAGPGLGAAVARRFADEGYAVGLVSRDVGRLDELAAPLRAGGATVATATADVGDDESLRSALRALAEELGPATVLVYNGSAYIEGSATEVAPDDLRTALDVGVVGALVAAQEVAGPMRERGTGTIVLTGSVAADRGSASAAAVGVAKAALRNLTLSLRKALEPDGVRVLTVTIDGVLSGPKALDLDEVAERYWRLHAAPEGPPVDVRHP